MGGPPGRTIGELLRTRRRRHFAGRRAEIDLFLSALDEADGFRVLHVHGPAGIGKTTLLDAYDEAARPSGATVVRFDGRDLAATPAAVLDVLAERLDVPAGDAPIAVTGADRLVLLVDGYEHLAVLDGWFRDRLLPRLPSSSVLVLAGRTPVAPEWRADPAWSEGLRAIMLRNLASDDARSYLDGRGVPSTRHAGILDVTYGHPLALSLVTDALAREPELDLTALPGDVVHGLLRRLVADVPSAAHRRALAAAALARSTGEGLLRHVLADAATGRRAFDWLETLPFVESRADGLVPHELVRDLLDADLRWRDPEDYRQVFRSVQTQALSRVRSTAGREQQRAVADLKFCFRALRGVLAPVAWGDWGDHYPDHAQPGDHAAILELIRSAEGEESARIADHWLDRQPRGFHVVRGTGIPVRGVVALIDLTAAGPGGRAVDPGALAAWEFARRTSPPRPGEVVTQCRFVVDAEAYQDPSPTLNAVPILTLQSQLATRGLAWDFVTLADPDRWESFFAAADMARATSADFDVGTRHFGSFGHDFRQVPVEAMIHRWTERALAEDSSFAARVEPEPALLVLAHPDFDAAVRQGLRDLHRADLLARNPLSRTRLLSGEDGSGPAAALEKLLRAAVHSLGDDPRDDRLFRAVDRTYVGTARTQEAAAATLGLPFSTYRRHLTQGVDRVVAWLWRRELGTEMSSTEQRMTW